VKAREFLAQTKSEAALRDLVKQPLTEAELGRLAAKAGGPRELVAPKQRAAAEAIPDQQLLAWLAADGKRVRRPIVEVGRRVTLGFTAESRAALEEILRGSGS
jgi:arsenate reductase